MKSLLTLAIFVAGLAAPALAEDAPATPPAPLAEAALTPPQGGATPVVLPEAASAAAMPMSVPLDSNAAPAARGGCHHEKTAVYLTN